MPAVEAWARCAEPKASFTYNSASFASDFETSHRSLLLPDESAGFPAADLAGFQFLTISSASQPIQSGENPTLQSRLFVLSSRMRKCSATGRRLIFGLGLPLGVRDVKPI